MGSLFSPLLPRGSVRGLAPEVSHTSLIDRPLCSVSNILSNLGSDVAPGTGHCAHCSLGLSLQSPHESSSFRVGTFDSRFDWATSVNWIHSHK